MQLVLSARCIWNGHSALHICLSVAQVIADEADFILKSIT